MAHFNFVISQNAKWGHAGFYIDCHRMTKKHCLEVGTTIDGRLPLLSTRPAVTPATLKRAATNFAAW